ncbi:DNA alkylation repair protein [Campylobacter blaseri]|uniref:DNA alkylation repair protein n=1 Tax=Campylobacter blaseri TaxID=2042961 RepID=A0A2P8R3S3_9BACT|nr:DNA alkylation repair protein [Campylobacter blaseri]PSM53133.1 hypothetical protein CQ405_00860 [Campylobacter blaseri]PSM54599.1 hypothetical protein CRN67_00860 [Campylobacter blaseri]QKF86928.1 DNA alkylation repair protein [Campylobacter blaseri]
MVDSILKELNLQKDEKYKKFNQKLIFTKQEILGVRLPALRKIAKNISKDRALKFIKLKKPNIYEIILLEGLVIGYAKFDFKTKIMLYEKYIQKVDNWAGIDCVNLNPKNLQDREILITHIKIWLDDESEFIARAGLINLLQHYVQKEYLDYIFSIKVKNNKYYSMMAHAWLISVCVVKFPDETINFLRQKILDKTTHNKAISKCIDSYRVSKENKDILRELRK